MNSALEFHDSIVESVSGSAEELVVYFNHAYVHVSPGNAGVDAGDVFLQTAVLVFSEPHFNSSARDASGKISDGFVRIRGRNFYLLPIPFTEVGEIEAEIRFTGGNSLVITANSVCCFLQGDRVWLENFHGQ
jgi:hypothetical protein